MARIGRLRRCEAGSTSLEFAIVGSVLLLVVLAIAAYGQAFWIWGLLQGAALDTARCSAIQATACSTTALAQSYGVTAAAQRGLGISTANVTVSTISTSGTACGGATGVVQVVIVYNTQWRVPLAPGLTPGTISATVCYPGS
jgi:Flp pilus assembly protein TadG